MKDELRVLAISLLILFVMYGVGEGVVATVRAILSIY